MKKYEIENENDFCNFGLTASADFTTPLIDETNAIMDVVSDIVSLQKLDDTLVHESIADAKKKRDESEVPIQSWMKSMRHWLNRQKAWILAFQLPLLPIQ